MEKNIKKYQVTTIITIILFLFSLIGWGYSAGRNSKINEMQNEKIERNETQNAFLVNKCNVIEHLTVVNNAKLELLLEHFDITE